MANNVNTCIDMENLNSNAVNLIKELYSRVRETEDYKWFGDMFVDGTNVTYEQSEKYEWTLENIGPKWCYIEDFEDSCFRGIGESGCTIRTVSAWGAPITGVENLLTAIAAICPDVVTEVTYEDEMPNFIGANFYIGDELDESSEWDYDEILEEIKKHHDIEEDEDGDLTEESQDIVWENIWETSHDLQQEFLSECRGRLNEDN